MWCVCVFVCVCVVRAQVRFGVLNAGNYGVPQSRKRTIIWAAAPNETLPDWPKQQHVFHSPQVCVGVGVGVWVWVWVCVCLCACVCVRVCMHWAGVCLAPSVWYRYICVGVGACLC